MCELVSPWRQSFLTLLAFMSLIALWSHNRQVFREQQKQLYDAVDKTCETFFSRSGFEIANGRLCADHTILHNQLQRSPGVVQSRRLACPCPHHQRSPLILHGSTYSDGGRETGNQNGQFTVWTKRTWRRFGPDSLLLVSSDERRAASFRTVGKEEDRGRKSGQSERPSDSCDVLHFLCFWQAKHHHHCGMPGSLRNHGIQRGRNNRHL